MSELYNLITSNNFVPGIDDVDAFKSLHPDLYDIAMNASIDASVNHDNILGITVTYKRVTETFIEFRSGIWNLLTKLYNNEDNLLAMAENFSDSFEKFYNLYSEFISKNGVDHNSVFLVNVNNDIHTHSLFIYWVLIRIKFNKLFSILNQINDNDYDNRSMILKLPTGVGKSTLFPLIMFIRMLGDKLPRILITQPRVITCTGIANGTFPSLLLGCRSNTIIGYTVGKSYNNTSDNKEIVRIMYATEGILSHKLLITGDNDIYNYDAIFIDEFHEKNIEINAILGIPAYLYKNVPLVNITVETAKLSAIVIKRLSDELDVDVSDNTVIDFITRKMKKVIRALKMSENEMKKIIRNDHQIDERYVDTSKLFEIVKSFIRKHWSDYSDDDYDYSDDDVDDAYYEITSDYQDIYDNNNSHMIDNFLGVSNMKYYIMSATVSDNDIITVKNYFQQVYNQESALIVPQEDNIGRMRNITINRDYVVKTSSLDIDKYKEATLNALRDFSNKISNYGTIVIFVPKLAIMWSLHRALLREEYTKQFKILNYYRGSEEIGKTSNKNIIITTDISETGVTLPNVELVIDWCHTNFHSYDPKTNVDVYDLKIINKNKQTQRMGRTGRTTDGTYIPLVHDDMITDDEYERGDDYSKFIYSLWYVYNFNFSQFNSHNWLWKLPFNAFVRTFNLIYRNKLTKIDECDTFNNIDDIFNENGLYLRLQDIIAVRRATKRSWQLTSAVVILLLTFSSEYGGIRSWQDPSPPSIYDSIVAIDNFINGGTKYKSIANNYYNIMKELESLKSITLKNYEYKTIDELRNDIMYCFDQYAEKNVNLPYIGPYHSEYTTNEGVVISTHGTKMRERIGRILSRSNNRMITNARVVKIKDGKYVYDDKLHQSNNAMTPNRIGFYKLISTNGKIRPHHII